MRDSLENKYPIETAFQRKLVDLLDKCVGQKWTVFADIAGIKHGTFQNYLLGKAKPKEKTLLKICRAGKVDRTYFDDTSDFILQSDILQIQENNAERFVTSDLANQIEGLKNIHKHRDERLVKAIEANIAAFNYTVDMAKEVQSLKSENKKLKKQLQNNEKSIVDE